MDDVSYKTDRLLGWCYFRLGRRTGGVRLLALNGKNTDCPNGSMLPTEMNASNGGSDDHS